MKKIFIVGLLILFCKGSYCQNVINFSKCKHVSFCMDCGEIKARFIDTLSIDKYFSRKINPESIKAITGQILIEVLILTNGEACCKSLINKTDITNHEIKKLSIDKIIDTMHLWIAASEGNEKQNSVVFLQLSLNNGDISVEYKTVQLN